MNPKIPIRSAYLAWVAVFEQLSIDQLFKDCFCIAVILLVFLLGVQLSIVRIGYPEVCLFHFLECLEFMWTQTNLFIVLDQFFQCIQWIDLFSIQKKDYKIVSAYKRSKSMFVTYLFVIYDSICSFPGCKHIMLSCGRICKMF